MAKLTMKLVEATLRNVHVIDGDTVDGMLLWGNWFTRAEIQTRVRLAGIDAPEMRPKPEPFAEEATQFLRDRIEGRTITVQFAIHKQTKEWIRESGGGWNNRRLIGILYSRWWNESLNISLVRHGMATIYPTPTWMVGWFESQLRQAQQDAQRKRRGIWQHAIVQKGRNRLFWWCMAAALLVVFLLWVF